MYEDIKKAQLIVLPVGENLRRAGQSRSDKWIADEFVPLLPGTNNQRFHAVEMVEGINGYDRPNTRIKIPVMVQNVLGICRADDDAVTLIDNVDIDFLAVHSELLEFWCGDANNHLCASLPLQPSG